MSIVVFVLKKEELAGPTTSLSVMTKWDALQCLLGQVDFWHAPIYENCTN